MRSILITEFISRAKKNIYIHIILKKFLLCSLHIVLDSIEQKDLVPISVTLYYWRQWNLD